MRDEHVDEANRELTERFDETVRRVWREADADNAELSPMERVERKKRRRDIDAYKRGYREGFDQAAWAIGGIIALALFATYWF